MKEMTKRILLAVVLALVICMVSMFYMINHINSITEKYEDMSVYVENQEKISQINENMYRIENQMFLHIVNSDDELYEEYEKEIETLQDNTSQILAELEEVMDSDKDRESLHQISKSYAGFESSLDIVLEFSRNGYKQSAMYYAEKLTPYINDTNAVFSKVVQNVKQTRKSAVTEMERMIRVIRIIEAVCLAVVFIIIILCISVVTTSGRKILDHQNQENKSHERKVMDLQFKTIVGMANLIESRDGETGEHVKRTGKFVDMIVA